MPIPAFSERPARADRTLWVILYDWNDHWPANGQTTPPNDGSDTSDPTLDTRYKPVHGYELVSTDRHREIQHLELLEAGVKGCLMSVWLNGDASVDGWGTLTNFKRRLEWMDRMFPGGTQYKLGLFYENTHFTASFTAAQFATKLGEYYDSGIFHSPHFLKGLTGRPVVAGYKGTHTDAHDIWTQMTAGYATYVAAHPDKPLELHYPIFTGWDGAGFAAERNAIIAAGHEFTHYKANGNSNNPADRAAAVGGVNYTAFLSPGYWQPNQVSAQLDRNPTLFETECAALATEGWRRVLVPWGEFFEGSPAAATTAYPYTYGRILGRYFTRA